MNGSVIDQNWKAPIMYRAAKSDVNACNDWNFCDQTSKCHYRISKLYRLKRYIYWGLLNALQKIADLVHFTSSTFEQLSDTDEPV